jgi:hypothetical protein
MLIGYVRVSKSDGTQTLAPQRDAMLAPGGRLPPPPAFLVSHILRRND